MAAEGRGGDERGVLGMPSNEVVKPVLDALILKRLHIDEIEDTYQMFLESCGEDVASVLINFLKILLATVPQGALRDILTVEETADTLGYNVEVMQNDVKELNKMFHEDQQKRLKTYLSNCKMFMRELINSETFSVFLKENHRILSALSTLMRLMCSSEYIVVKDIGFVAILEMFEWLLKNESQEPETSGLFDNDAMEVDGIGNPFSTYLASNKARVLECMSEALIRDSNHTNRLKILNCIRANFGNHLEIVNHDGIQKGLAFCIMDSSSAVQLSSIQFLLELLKNVDYPELIDWFFDKCQISPICVVVPVNLLVDNLSPTASEDMIDTSMKIILHLEKHSPGRIHPTALNFLFLSLCSTYKVAIESVGALVHSVLCDSVGAHQIATYDQFKKYMNAFYKFQQPLSKSLPDYMLINPWMGSQDSPLLNFDYLVKYLLEGEVTDLERHDLLKLLSTIVCQLKGESNCKFKIEMLVNDLSTDVRRDKLVSFVCNLPKLLDLLMRNEATMEQCLFTCLNIIAIIPTVFLSEELLCPALKKLIESVLLSDVYDHEKRLRIVKLLAHLDRTEKRHFKALVKDILAYLIVSFSVEVSKLADHDAITNSEMQSSVIANCRNMVALSEFFDIGPIVEGLNCRPIIHLLSKMLLITDHSRIVKLEVMTVRHALLVIDVYKNFELFGKRHDRAEYNLPKYKFEECIASYPRNISKMIPILIDWLGNLEDPDEVLVLEMIGKELQILHCLRKWNTRKSPLTASEFETRVIIPLKGWIQARVPVHHETPTEIMRQDSIELAIEKILSLLEDKSLPLSHFVDFLVFYLKKNHPVAIKVLTKGNLHVETASSIIFDLTKLFLEEVKVICQNSLKKKAVEAVASRCMTLIKNIIMSMMHNNYDMGRRVAQKSVSKVVAMVLATDPKVLPEMAVAPFIFPWFGIIFQHCMPPMIYSSEDLQSWKALSAKYPRIANLLTHLCKRTDENRPANLNDSILEMILIPEKYITL